MQNTCSIVLSAGEGTRMKSNMPKVLSQVLFEPMLGWVLEALETAGITETCVVTGYKSKMVTDYLNTLPQKYETVLQTERKGTAHAVMTAEKFLKKNIEKDVLILNGDAPFIDSDTIKNAYEQHKRQKNAATVISARVQNPFGYGRIVRNESDNTLTTITEQKDADEKIQKINEVNSGAYWFSVKALLNVLHRVTDSNASGEFYLPDTISLLLKQKNRVDAYASELESTVLGANNRVQLNELNTIARMKILNELMKKGVDIPVTDGIIITKDVLIGQNTTILPGSIITKGTIIGTNCTIGPNTYIENSLIGNDITLNSIHCVNSRLFENTYVRPFSVVKNNEFV